MARWFPRGSQYSAGSNRRLDMDTRNESAMGMLALAVLDGLAQVIHGGKATDPREAAKQAFLAMTGVPFDPAGSTNEAQEPTPLDKLRALDGGMKAYYITMDLLGSYLPVALAAEGVTLVLRGPGGEVVFGSSSMTVAKGIGQSAHAGSVAGAEAAGNAMAGRLESRMQSASASSAPRSAAAKRYQELGAENPGSTVDNAELRSSLRGMGAAFDVATSVLGFDTDPYKLSETQLGMVAAVLDLAAPEEVKSLGVKASNMLQGIAQAWMAWADDDDKLAVEKAAEQVR